MRRAHVLLACVTLVLPLLPAAAAAAEPASRSSAQPLVGECYDLTEAQAAADYWVDQDPVPCTRQHTFEVTEAALVPMDVNAITFARDRCGPLDVWTALAVNSSSAGIIEDPIRIEARSFVARPDHYVCGAVAVAYAGRDPLTLVPLASAIERLRTRERYALRHCADASEGRSAFAPPVTVPCGQRPVWQVTRWILWSALYDDDPGRGVLRERARDLCGAGAVFSLPTPSSWSTGMPRTWCYRKHP